jgi:hypothetical protein
LTNRKERKKAREEEGKNTFTWAFGGYPAKAVIL